jgi:hypothetical protein
LAITFEAILKFERNKPIIGGGRYSPIVHFLDVDDECFVDGTIVDADWPLAAGETKSVRIELVASPDLSELATVLDGGDHIELFEGNIRIATGSVTRIFDRSPGSL